MARGWWTKEFDWEIITDGTRTDHMRNEGRDGPRHDNDNKGEGATPITDVIMDASSSAAAHNPSEVCR
jgi:hypothetical protein